MHAAVAMETSAAHADWCFWWRRGGVELHPNTKLRVLIAA